MKVKKLPAKKLVEFPTCLSPTAEYPISHAFKHLTHYVVFAGRLDSETFVVHDELTDIQVIRLQLILANPATVKNVEYTQQLMRLLHMKPTVMLDEFANTLQMSRTWILDRLGIKDINLNLICLANAYALSRIKDWSGLASLAVSKSPQEFLPLAHARAREERLSRSAK